MSIERSKYILIFVIGYILIFSLGQSSTAWAQESGLQIEMLRVIETDELFDAEAFDNNIDINDLQQGIAFPPGANTVLTELDELILVALGGQPSTRIQVDPRNLAFDPNDKDAELALVNRLFVYASEYKELITISSSALGFLNPDTITRFDMAWLNISDPRGITFDPEANVLYLVDGPQIVRIQLRAGRTLDGVTSYQIEHHGLGDISAIAFNPQNGNLYVFSPSTGKLIEMSVKGDVIANGTLSLDPTSDLRGMAFHPSLDLTDDPKIYSLFIATNKGVMGELTEWSLEEPSL